VAAVLALTTTTGTGLELNSSIGGESLKSSVLLILKGTSNVVAVNTSQNTNTSHIQDRTLLLIGHIIENELGRELLGGGLHGDHRLQNKNLKTTNTNVSIVNNNIYNVNSGPKIVA